MESRRSRQVPTTRGWVETTMGGPCGAPSPAMQSPVLVWRITGITLAFTRTADTSHCTRRHGCGAPDTFSTQPAIRYWSAMVATGMPLRRTRGPDGTSVTVPPWGHSATMPTWAIGPGIGSDPFRSGDRERGRVDVDGRSHQRDDGAVAVRDRDPDVVHGDERPRGGLEQDAAGGPGQVADHERVLGLRLDHHVGHGGRGGQRQCRHLGGDAVPAPRPDREVG